MPGQQGHKYWIDRAYDYLGAARIAADRTQLSTDGALWDHLEAELPKIRRVLSHLLALGDTKAVELGLQLTGGLRELWRQRGLLPEGRRWMDGFLALAIDADIVTRARALDDSGALAFWAADYPVARARAESALALERLLGNDQRVAVLLSHLGSVIWLGELAPEKARPYVEESLRMARGLEDFNQLSGVLHLLGQLTLDLGDAETARTVLEELLQMQRRAGDRGHIAYALTVTAVAARQAGDGATARLHLVQALELGRSLGDRWFLAEAIEAVAEVLAADGEAYSALCLAAKAASLRRVLQTPEMPALRARYLRSIALARELTTRADAAAAEIQGFDMSLEYSIDYAIDRLRTTPADDA